MVVLLALLVALAPSRATNEPDYVATLVGRAFLRAVAERDVDRAANLCGPSVNFDGIEASGRDVRRYLARMTDRLPQGYTSKPSESYPTMKLFYDLDLRRHGYTQRNRPRPSSCLGGFQNSDSSLSSTNNVDDGASLH